MHANPETGPSRQKMLKWPSAVVKYQKSVFKCMKIFFNFLASPPAPLQRERGVVCSRGHKVEMAFIMSQSQWSGAAVGVGRHKVCPYKSVRSPERANVIYRRYNRYLCMGVLLHTTPLSEGRGGGGEAVPLIIHHIPIPGQSKQMGNAIMSDGKIFFFI